MEESKVRGSCLCGKVSYEIRDHFGIFQYCHCSRCRKFTGSAFAANLLVPPTAFQWLGGESYVGRYILEEAKHFATGFCKVCGSSLPWLAQSGKTVVIPAGTLDQDPHFKPMQNIHFASRAVWYLHPGLLPEYDELPAKK
ncbi:MAG: GFA family protein [Candidatus Thiodiazotropha sp. (ex Monitilora ramsayi)]|nr:GFA family protein [Candidatus Thiodiazotropha sp. (ex Monitilora ramsayi)]